MTKKISTSVLFVASIYGWATCQGCSYLSVQPAPAGVPHTVAIHCTTDRTAPVIDTIFAATDLASAVYVASQDQVTNKGLAVTLGIAVAGLWMSSAIYGYKHTSECEELLSEEDDGTPYRPANYMVVVPGALPSPVPAPPAAPRPPPAPAVVPQNGDGGQR